MGWGGIGTPFPHPNFISKFIIVFPVRGNRKKIGAFIKFKSLRHCWFFRML